MSTENDKKAILCVDDEAIILMDLMMLLRTRYGDRFLYEQAGDAEKALKVLDGLFLRGVRIILIVSDWMMPGMSGEELIRIVYDRYPSLKVIMVSGKIKDDSATALKRDFAGFRFLAKPIDPDEFYKTVDSLVEQQ